MLIKFTCRPLRRLNLRLSLAVLDGSVCPALVYGQLLEILL